MLATLRILSVGVVVLIAQSLHAQSSNTIEEVIVTAHHAPHRVVQGGLVLDSEAIREQMPPTVAGLFANVPGLTMRTNSRGDTVVRIRGSEERQTLVFLDGAPLATPWDGRADLSLLPAGLISQVSVIRDLAPIEYGANAIAGVIDLQTFSPSEDDGVRLELLLGQLGLTSANAMARMSGDNALSFVAGVSSIERDAIRIAKRSSVVFDPSITKRRTNTDYSSDTLYTAVGYSGDALSMRASLLSADVERGVAAQGDLDPAIANPRFWRIPDWHLTQAALNSVWNIQPDLDLRTVVWHQSVEQQINAYRDYSYTALREVERGSDRTIGIRMALSRDFERTTFRLVSTAQQSTHWQNISTNSTGEVDDLKTDPPLKFRQQLLTTGIESDFLFADNLKSTLSLVMDHASNPLAGDKPDQGSQSAPGWSAGTHWEPSEKWKVKAIVGQRSRFPSPRELFGEALGRFLLNPDIQPERSLLTSLTVDFEPIETTSFAFSVWTNSSADALSQRVVGTNRGRLRQRYNSPGSFAYGAEASASVAVTGNLRFDLSAAFQTGHFRRDDEGTRPAWIQRPTMQRSLAVDWQPSERLDLRSELVYTNDANDLGNDGGIVRLPSSTAINLRGFFILGRVFDQETTLGVAIENVTDELILPQSGLPIVGRSFQVGIRLN